MMLENDRRDPSVWLNRFLQRNDLDPNLAVIAEGLKKFQFSSLNKLISFIKKLLNVNFTRSEDQLELSKEDFVSKLIEKNPDLKPLKEKLNAFCRNNKDQDLRRFLKEFDEPDLGDFLVSLINLENAVFFTMFYYYFWPMMLTIGNYDD